MSKLLKIDGSHGEGGGQIVRSSLALSIVTGTPIVIEHIRAGRKKSGLMRQHLTAVKAAAKICDARTEGAAIGSKELTFLPNQVRAGDYEFKIGTAGSTMLVLQTVLPALLLADAKSTVALEGGTHNMHAPPFDFIDRAYLPLLRNMGPAVTAKLERPGFYPAGGGRVVFEITGSTSLKRLELTDRGKILARRACATVAKLPPEIASREIRTLQNKSQWNESCFHVEELDNSAGPGNIVTIELQSQHVTELFSGFGKLGVRAEQVAKNAWKECNRYIKADVPVGEHLADQLLLPMGLGAHFGGGGGVFRTLDLSQHSTTHIDVLNTFLDIDVQIEQRARDDCTVRIEASR